MDVIGIAVSIAGKALGKNIKTPTIPFPLFTLKELYVKIAAGTFKVGGETFYMGLTFEAKWVLFGKSSDVLPPVRHVYIPYINE